MPSPSNDWVALAAITQPHGVRGEMKLISFSAPPEGFAQYKTLTDASGAPVQLRITGSVGELFIVRAEGVNDRNDAERWRGKQFGVLRAELPTIEKIDRFYVAELEGMEVVDTAGAHVGKVSAVTNFGASDLLEINHEFYAFTDANFPHIDRQARRITFTPPEILGSKAEEEGAA